MPGFLTDYANNKALDLIFGGVPYTPPGVLYVGLSWNPADKLGRISEPPGTGGYARVPLPNTLASFSASLAGKKGNLLPVVFPRAVGDWGVIVSLFVSDALAGGNLLLAADLPSPTMVKAWSTPPTLFPGTLSITHT